MEIHKDNNVVLKYTISGFVVGLATVLFVLFLDLIVRDLSINQMWEIHSQNPVYIILDLSPFVLALYAYLLSKRYTDITRKLNDSLNKERTKIYKLYNLVEELRKGNTNASYELQDDNDMLGSAVLTLRGE